MYDSHEVVIPKMKMSFKEYIDSSKEKETHEEFVTKIRMKEAVICVDNKAAAQIVAQDGGSWRTRHLRIRASVTKEKIEKKRFGSCTHQENISWQT